MSAAQNIQRIIQRIGNLTILQNHFQFIRTILTRIQSSLSERDVPTSIEQILECIEELVISCSENVAYFDGYTYRDYKFVLFQIHWLLSQYEISLTNDQEARKLIETTNFQDQNLFIEEKLNESLQQTLQNIEQISKQTSEEKLKSLNEKHDQVIIHYLKRYIELHKNTRMECPSRSTIAKIVELIYKFSLDNHSESEDDWTYFELSLKLTNIKLKYEKSTLLSRKLQMNIIENSNEDNQKSVVTPYVNSLIEKLFSTEDQNMSEENLFGIGNKRWVLIKGDPGSGKTSFVRSIAHHFAEQLLLNEYFSNIFGPLKVPIVIQIKDFSSVLSTDSSITLFDYIGEHKWMEQTIVVNEANGSHRSLSSTLQEYVTEGQALIILDGLDDIFNSNICAIVMNAIAKFIEEYVPTSSNIFDQGNYYLNKLFDDPSKTGGNQLFITSRSIDSDRFSLFNKFTQYTVEPMSKQQTKDFIKHWFHQFHKQLLNRFQSRLPNQGEIHANVLIKELEQTENDELMELGSNCRLISLICLVFLNQLHSGTTNIRRIHIYDQIIKSILHIWDGTQSIIDKSQLIRIMSHIAFSIQDNPSSKTIDKKDVKNICREIILDRSSETHILNITHAICDTVGFLVVCNQSSYGFLHPLFQNYFTSLKLIEMMKSDEIKSIHRYTNDKRFLTPIKVALVKISLDWSQNDFDQICSNLIQENKEFDNLLPFGAYILIYSMSDFVKKPSDHILIEALNRLMVAAGQHKWSVVCPFLYEKIAFTLRKYSQEFISLWIDKFLSESPRYDIETVSAFCHFIEGPSYDFRNIKWLNQDFCSKLQSLSKLDSENNEYAIDRLLIKIAFTDSQLLPANSMSLKKFLIDEHIDSNTIPVSILPLIIIVYGGLERDGHNVTFNPTRIHRDSAALTSLLKSFLSEKDLSRRDRKFGVLRRECLKSFLEQKTNSNESDETIDLLIAVICLSGMNYIKENFDNIPNRMLHMAMNRLKHVSHILRQFYFANSRRDRSVEDWTTKFISKAVENFQYTEASRIMFLDLLDALRSAIARLRSAKRSFLFDGQCQIYERVTLTLPNALRNENNMIHGLLSNNVELGSNLTYCSLLPFFTKLFWINENNDEFCTRERMFAAVHSIPKYLVFRVNDLLSSLTYVPQHLQNLYLRLLKQNFIIVHLKQLQANTNQQYLYLNHILCECLMKLSNSTCRKRSVLSAVITLLPWLRLQQLENLGSSLFWSLSNYESEYMATIEAKKNITINSETGLYTNVDEHIFNGKSLAYDRLVLLIRNDISQEQQRLTSNSSSGDERDMKIYSASVSLTHMSRWIHDEQKLNILEECIKGAMSITNEIARFDALCAIAHFSPLDYHEIKIHTGRNLEQEIEHQLNELYPKLPLLLHAMIFIRCLSLIRNRNLIDSCIQNLFNKIGDNDKRDQQAVIEALLPYIKLNETFSPIINCFSTDLNLEKNVFSNKSLSLKKYFNMVADQQLPMSLIISSLYTIELTNDLHQCVQIDDSKFTIDKSIIETLCQLDSSVLTEVQAWMITNILSSGFPKADKSQQYEQILIILDKALHNMNEIEFKARRLVESWLKLKDSNKLSSFAWHAAILLANSYLWSVDVASIVCDLLQCENDRFRQRSQAIFRSPNDVQIQTSSLFGIDVLLTLLKKRIYFQVTSASSNRYVLRLFSQITLDNESHLTILLWLERYRIHALLNEKYSFKELKSSKNLYVASFFTDDMKLDACSFINMFSLSNDLVVYMCDMIASNFFSFLEIEGDSESVEVNQSHSRFVATVVSTIQQTFNNNSYTRGKGIRALMKLMDLLNLSTNNEVCRAAAYTLGYVCDARTSNDLLKKIQSVTNRLIIETSNNSNEILATLIVSYCHCLAINKKALGMDDFELLTILLKHSSSLVVSAVRDGFGRTLQDTPFLLDMLRSDSIECYRALINSTAYIFPCNIQMNRELAAAEFIIENLTLLPMFINELFDSIRHFTKDVMSIQSIDYEFAYGYPQYVVIAHLLTKRIPTIFCGYIDDYIHANELKEALFYASKQHYFPRRAACIEILSAFGELTVNLCQMLIDGLYDDPYIQQTCYKSLKQIKSIKDKKNVLDLLRTYLKSKSLNFRYLSVKILIHLSESSLVSFDHVRDMLDNLMADPASNEELWLIKNENSNSGECIYEYAGSLKDVVYSLFIQYMIGDTSDRVKRHKFNEIQFDFVESSKASRFASCLYEQNSQNSQ